MKRKDRRRGLVFAAGFAATALLAAGCSSGSSSTDGATPAVSGGSRASLLSALPADAQEAAKDVPDDLLKLLVQVRAEGPKDLVWVDAGGEVHDGWNTAFLNDWQTITGWKVVEAAPGLDLSTAEVKAQVDSKNTEWDLFAILDYGTAEKLAKEGYWEPLDYRYFDLSQIPAVDYYSDAHGNLVQGQSTTTYPSTGYYVGASDYGIVLDWNTKKWPVSGVHPDSTKAFFDTKDFPGKRCAFNYAQFGGNLEFAAMADGVPFDQVYQYLADPANVKKSLAKFDAIYKDIVWVKSGADSIQFLLDGQCDLGITYNGRVALRKKAQPDLPVAITWKDSIINGGPFAILKGAPHKDAAESLYAFSMLPSRQCAALNAIGYGVVLKAPEFPGCLTDFGKTWSPQYDVAAGVADPHFFSDRPQIEEQWSAWQSSH